QGDVRHLRIPFCYRPYWLHLLYVPYPRVLGSISMIEWVRFAGFRLKTRKTPARPWSRHIGAKYVARVLVTIRADTTRNTRCCHRDFDRFGGFRVGPLVFIYVGCCWFANHIASFANLNWEGTLANARPGVIRQHQSL